MVLHPPIGSLYPVEMNQNNDTGGVAPETNGLCTSCSFVARGKFVERGWFVVVADVPPFVAEPFHLATYMRRTHVELARKRSCGLAAVLQ